MLVTLNGTMTSLPDGSTVADVLGALGRTGTPCAVERNNELLPWRDRDDVRLEDGDALEVVTLVGGG